MTGVARTFEGRGLGLDELVEAGNEGLLRAAEQFDWRQGRKFAPYAASWIRQSIHTRAHGHAPRGLTRRPGPPRLS